nr:MAG TPA: hypothetical protein [Caudoviricetes sp.]
MSLFNILSREGVGTGLEDVVSDTIIEKEHVIVARLLNFAQLKKANKAVVIEQYMVKVDKTDKNAGSGSIRIRKVTDRKGNVHYEMTTKNNVRDGRIETTTVANEMMFKQMQALADGGMLKHRYSFNIKGTDFVWEVDVVPDGSGGYKQWCLCECEVSDLATQKPELPIETEEAYLSPSLNDKADEETFMAKKREVLERFFIQDNPFLKEKAELTQLKGEDSIEEENNEATNEAKTDETTTGEETLSVDNITDEKEVADKVEERAEQILEKQEPEAAEGEAAVSAAEDSTDESEETDSTEEGGGYGEEDTAVEAEEGSEETEISQDSFHSILQNESVTFTEETIQRVLQLGNESYTPSIGQAISSANQIIGRKANFVFDKLGSHDLDFAIAVPLQEKLKLVTKNTPAKGFFSWFKRDPSNSYVFVKDGYTGICLTKGQFYGFRKFSDRTIWLESFVAEADLFRKAYKAVLEDVKYWNKYRAAFAAKCKELAKKYTFSKDANRIAYELDYLILDIVPNLGKYASGLDYVNTGTFPANDKTMIIENIAVPSDEALNQLRELEKEAYVAFSQSITMPPADSRVTQYEDFFLFSDLIMEAFGVSKEEAYAMVYHGIINIDGPTNYFLTNTNNSVFTFLYILTCFSKVAHLVTLGGKVYHSTLSEFYDMVNVEDNIK